MTTLIVLPDFDPTPQTIVFSSSDERTTGSISIPTTDDDINEQVELFIATLSVADSDVSAVNITGTALGQILDNDSKRNELCIDMLLTLPSPSHQHSSVSWV